MLLSNCVGKKDSIKSAHSILKLSDTTFIGTEEFTYTMDSTLGVHLLCKSLQKIAKGLDSAIIIFQNTKNDFMKYSFNTQNYRGIWSVYKYDTNYNKNFNILNDSFSSKEFATFSYYNPDSILLLKNTLYICNDAFKVSTKYDIEGLIKKFYPLQGRFVVAAHNNKFMLQKYNENIIGCKVRNYKPKVEHDREDTTWFFIFNTVSNKVEIYPIPIPNECKDFVWGFNDGTQYGTIANNKLYISYPYSEEITVFDLETKTYLKKRIKSAFHDKNDIYSVYTQKQFLLLNKFHQISKLWEEYIIQNNISASYSHLLYEPKFNRYIRFYFDSQPVKNKEGLYNLNPERNAYMLVLNKDLDIEYEMELGKGFNDFVSFTSNGKVYIDFNQPSPYGNNQTYRFKVINFNK
ncbi:MAG: hypothetical protein SGJ10_09165 [Bacteroidota bacterium]|nr:hypothetical protein [Bacteroidota bacterium]